MEMESTDPEGFSQASVALQPSDFVSWSCGELCTQGRTQDGMVLWPPLHQGGWERGRVGVD